MHVKSDVARIAAATVAAEGVLLPLASGGGDAHEGGLLAGRRADAEGRSEANEHELPGGAETRTKVTGNPSEPLCQLDNVINHLSFTYPFFRMRHHLQGAEHVRTTLLLF